MVERDLKKRRPTTVIAPTVHVRSVIHGSIVFNRAACRHALRALELDKHAEFLAMDARAREYRYSELEDTALAAVLASTMAVEAIVNELYLQHSVAHKPDAWFAGTSETLSEALHDAWRSGVRGLSLMDRCQMAAVIAGKGKFDTGQGTAQQFDLLVKLRNELGRVHTN